MPTFDRLLPWRWKSKVHAALDAKFDKTRSALATALNDVQTQLEAQLEAHMAATRAQISDLRADIYDVSQALSSPPFDASLHRLRSASADVERGLTALKNEIAAQVGFSLHDMASQMADQRRWLERISADFENLPARLGGTLDGDPEKDRTADGLRPSPDELVDRISERQARLEKALVTYTTLLAHLDAGLQSRFNRLEKIAPPAFWTEAADDFRSKLDELNRKMDESSHRSNDQQAWLEKISLESTNGIAHVNTGLHSRLNKLENVVLPGILEQIHETAAVQLRILANQADRSAWRADPDERYAPARPEVLDIYLEEAAREFPRIYGLWRERLDATRKAFDGTKIGNAAHVADLYSRTFRDFVEIHAAGRVLDVGCGVFGRPYYLAAYPAELVSGLEPLPARDAADFELVCGISEYLPWPDGSFSTVISGTSLDHCMSLTRSLSEMTRVLRPGGSVLLWISSVPGSPRYEPDRPEFTPADQFHLFHFDKEWFEPMLDETFDLIDRVELRRTDYSHVFYCLRPKSGSQRNTPEPSSRQTAEALA